MKSGTIVERRDQVRTTFFSLFSFIAATFFARWSSVNGPFFSDLLIVYSRLLSPAASRQSLFHLPAHNPLIRPLVISGLESARRLSPGRNRMPAAGRLAFAAAVRVIHWIHGDTAIVRLLPQPSRLSRLAVRFVLVLHVAHLADAGHAFHLHLADFARRQLQQRDPALAGNQLGLRAGRSHHLRAFAWPQLNIVDHGAGPDIFQRQLV